MSLQAKQKVLKLLVFNTMMIRRTKHTLLELLKNKDLLIDPEEEKEEVKPDKPKPPKQDNKQPPPKKDISDPKNPVRDTPPPPKPEPEQPQPKVEPNTIPEKPPEPEVQSHSTNTNKPWMKSMYRKLQKNIHPDRNTSVANEATKIHFAMEQDDIVAALYSFYIYHDECPVPDEQLHDIFTKVQKEYMDMRKQFDNQPPDILLRSAPKVWRSMIDKCVVSKV